MIKNVAILLLILVCIAEGAYIVKTRHNTTAAFSVHQATAATQSSSAPKRPSLLLPGMKFQDNPLFSKAYKIAPGALSAGAQKALTGWKLQQQTLADGSIQVSLIPLEAEDVQQQFTVKPGYSLYFIEMNLTDDTTQKDNNRQDDMGVLVDQNGIVQ